MKNLGCIFFFIMVFSIGCKKETVQHNDGNNNNGQNACDTITCGLHQHCVNDTCRCDSGWGGNLCGFQLTPTGTTSTTQLAGDYLVNGSILASHYLPPPAYDSLILVTNDTLHITALDPYSISATLSVYPHHAQYNPSCSNDSVISFDMGDCCWEYDTIRVFIHYPDSIWCSFYGFSHTAGWKYTLGGRKIH